LVLALVHVVAVVYERELGIALFSGDLPHHVKVAPERT